MKKLSFNKNSIFAKIFIPVFMLMILQTSIFIGVVFGGSVIDQLRTNAYDILTERVVNRKREVDTLFSVNWTNLDTSVGEINDIYETLSKEANIFTDTEAKKKFIISSYEPLTQLLRKNNVNGVFLILNNSEEYIAPTNKTPQTNYGISIRDLDQSSGYKDTEDLLLERAPASTLNDIGYTLDSWWEPFFTFDSEQESDFFYYPLKSAYENPGTNYDDLAYFSLPHNLSESDSEVVSYSVPLINSDGIPYAVLGIELTTSYLQSILPNQELNGQNLGSYALMQTKDGGNTFTPCVSSGIFYKKSFDKTDVLTPNKNLNENCLEFTSRDGTSICGSVRYLNIYNKNTPFEQEQLALIGFVDHSELLGFSDKVSNALILSYVISAVIGVIGVLLINRKFAAPITALSKKVQSADSRSAFELEHIGIFEIDQLIDSIQTLSTTVSKNQAKTKFFSRMSHDMRTPMNAIIGFSDKELADSADDAQKSEYLKKINESGTYLLGLINEVLDISKIESDKMKLNYKPQLIVSFLDSVIPIIKEIADKKGINFISSYSSLDENCIAIIDKQRLQQIFVNLLSNAVKFTPKGGTVTFTATVLSKTDSHILLRFVVEDNGIGMSEEFQNKLFEQFEQENPGQDGTGLGLSIAKNLIELMGGTISCKSHQGEGTIFTVILESQLTNDLPPDELNNTELSLDSFNALNGKKILLCEDHPLNTQIAVSLLAKKGVLCTHAPNGKSAVDMFNQSKPGYYDAILMDIRMPIMNGLEATKEIRKLNRPDSKTVPIIAMTANAFDEDIEQSMEAGMNEHLAKPINPKLLYLALIKHIYNE